MWILHNEREKARSLAFRPAAREMEKGRSSSSRASPPGGGEGGRSWRKEADDNLRRLHSLVFAADVALERGDCADAQILGLRLLGFLDSRTETAVDAAFVAPIRAEVCSKIDVARHSLAPESDR